MVGVLTNFGVNICFAPLQIPVFEHVECLDWQSFMWWAMLDGLKVVHGMREVTDLWVDNAAGPAKGAVYLSEAHL